MAGEYVPLVMVPRFTTYVGAGVYGTVALDVSAYGRFVVTFWSGPLIGTSPTLSAVFEDSDDAEVWATVAGTSAITSPNGSTVVEADLTRRWLRAKVTLAGTDNTAAITCWAAGHLERRGAE